LASKKKMLSSRSHAYFWSLEGLLLGLSFSIAITYCWGSVIREKDAGLVVQTTCFEHSFWIFGAQLCVYPAQEMYNQSCIIANNETIFFSQSVLQSPL
jgi:hypothetical protein